MLVLTVSPECLHGSVPCFALQGPAIVLLWCVVLVATKKKTNLQSFSNPYYRSNYPLTWGKERENEGQDR